MFKQSILILSCLFLISCEKSIFFNTDKFSFDDELISMIQQSNDKSEVQYDELPENTKSYINSDLHDEIFLSELKANGLGYELTYAKSGYEDNEFQKIYFNLTGKKLKSSKEKKYSDCIKLIFPISFNMPDYTDITVTDNSEQGWFDLKNWYLNHPDTKFEWDLQYPVEIIHNDTELISVNNFEEMIELKKNCN